MTCDRCPLGHGDRCPARTMGLPALCRHVREGHAGYLGLVNRLASGAALATPTPPAAKPRVPLGVPHCPECVRSRG